MTIAYAVIGAGFGDEGKGITTDYLTQVCSMTTRGFPPIVARFNSGAQAGHTVVSKDGKRHVFSHFGAGTLSGATTYLSADFVVNFDVYNSELTELEQLGISIPQVVVSKQCRITIPQDIWINQAIETARGDKRHGSCGLGFNEAVTRSKAGFNITVDMILNESDITLKQMLYTINNRWIPYRLKQLGIHAVSVPDFDYNKLIKSWRKAVKVFDTSDIKASYNPHPIILEGAQGLMLDQHLGKFPHVTHSVTGVANAIRAAVECGKSDVIPVYVTRCYATRHGAGPLPHEGEKICDNVLIDKTNSTNTWQGAFRYAPLDIDELKKFIRADMARGQAMAEFFGVKLQQPLISLTCLDQVGDTISFYEDGVYYTLPTDEFAEQFPAYMGYQMLFESHSEVASV